MTTTEIEKLLAEADALAVELTHGAALEMNEEYDAPRAHHPAIGSFRAGGSMANCAICSAPIYFGARCAWLGEVGNMGQAIDRPVEYTTWRDRSTHAATHS